MEQTKSALREAITKAGGLAAFADCIHAPSAGAVKGWLHTGSIPADYCPRIERLTGIECERLRPSLDWSYLRNSLPTPKATA